MAFPPARSALFPAAFAVCLALVSNAGCSGTQGGADFPPTDTSIGLVETIEKDLNAARADYRNLLEREIPAFNRAIGGAMTPLTGGRDD